MVVFLERKLGVSVFSSLFMWGGTSLVGSDLEWQSQRKNYFKNGFSFAGSHLPSRKFIWSEDLPFSFLVSCIDRELFCFPPTFSFSLSSDLFLFTFFRSLIGNPSFPFFSFFPFLYFQFFLFFLFISSFSFFSLGNRVLAFYLLSLEEIPLSFASGERMRILFIGQGSE